MKRRLLSAFVVVTLMASVISGAIGVSINIANANSPSDYTGYLDDLLYEAEEDLTLLGYNTFLSDFNAMKSYVQNNFDSCTIVIYRDEEVMSWYFGVYTFRTDFTFSHWMSFPNDHNNARCYYNDNGRFSNKFFYQLYCIKWNSSSGYHSSTSTQTDQLLGYNFSWTNSQMNYCPSSNIFSDTVECYCNRNFYSYNGSTTPSVVSFAANLVEGSYVPPVIEFNWFKFNLGDRWYVTTYDQSLVNNIGQEADTAITWFIGVYAHDDILGETLYDALVLNASDLIRLSYAENFMTQTLTNVDPSGVFAYDITDMINNPELASLKNSTFQLWYENSEGESWPLYTVAESDDVISLDLTPNQEDPARNEAWNIINNYIENYPSVTISPAALAPQLSGQTAIAGGMGWLQVPSAMYDWAVNTNRINDYDPSLTDDFEFRLNSESLSPTEMSLINYDILDAVVLAADAVGSVTDPYLHYWMAENSLSAYFVDRMSYQECLDSFDIILIVKNNSWYLGNVYDNLSAPDFALTAGTYSYTNLHKNQLMPVPSTTAIDNSVYYCYWILTPRAIQKSQLFAFCDGFHKLYDLASEYVQKKDLWDNSFFEWSMSIFYQLESINGYLSNVQSKLDTVISSLQRLEQNTSETDVEPWFLSLLNWVRRFPVTDLDFVRWINNYDTFQDSLEYPETTVIPLPTTVPTSAVGG